jgi:hypothetical protein
MASAKRTPKVSRISRGRTVAYARKQKPADGGADGGSEESAEDAPPGTDEAVGSADAPAAAAPAAPAAEPVVEAAPAAPVEAPAAPVEAPAAPAEPEAARPDAAPPAPEPVVARIETAPMPAQAPVGAPPAMPAASIGTPAAAVDAAEDPTRMPGPRDLPAGHPDDPDTPPGRVPPGDSRSLRRRADRHEFALVYRQGSFVISRVGVVGTRGQWRVVEYPTPSMASHAYAKECSRFVSDGFSDYRE